MARTIFIHKGRKTMNPHTWAPKSLCTLFCAGCTSCTDTCWPHFGCIHDVSDASNCIKLPAVPLPSCRFMK